MAKISMADVEKAAGNESGSASNSGNYQKVKWLSLKNDKESRKVKFLYKNVQDIEVYKTHKVRLPNLKFDIRVDCLGDDCPFCKASQPEVNKTHCEGYLQIFDPEEKAVKLWVVNWFALKRISNILKYAPEGSELVNANYMIVRNGAPGYNRTTYDCINVGKDEVTLDELNKQNFNPYKILGSVVQQKSVEDMQYFLEHGDFPKKQDNK